MSLTFCAVLAKRIMARNKFTRLTLPNKFTNKRMNGQRILYVCTRNIVVLHTVSLARGTRDS